MGKPNIICVDDEMIILRSLREQLDTEFGHEYIIEIAESGDEAISMLEEHMEFGEEIPLIISDYIMPGLKGDELLEKVNSLNPGTISILLTGQATLKGVKNALNNAGVYRYIPKPWSKESLCMAVRDALDAYNKREEKLADNSILKETNFFLEKEIEENDKKIEKNKRILKSMEKLSVINRITEDLANEVSDSLESIKNGIENIRMMQKKADASNHEGVEEYIENVDSFYKLASDKINKLVNSFQDNMISYIVEPGDKIDIAKLLFRISSMRGMFEGNFDNNFSERTREEKPFTSGVEKIAAWEEEEILLFNPEEVLFFSKESNSTVVVTIKGKYKVREGLEKWESKLGSRNFFRCHRSYLVNLKYVSKITPWIGQNSHISKLDGFPYEVPISRDKIREMKRILGI